MLKFFIDESSEKLDDLIKYVRDSEEFESFVGEKVLYKLQDCLDELEILKKYLEFK